MVGNLTFSQRFKLAQLRELNGVERHRIMKQSAWDINWRTRRYAACLRRSTTKPLWKEAGLDAIGQIPDSGEGRGEYFS